MPAVVTTNVRIVHTTHADLSDAPSPEMLRSDAMSLIASAYESARKSGMSYEEARSLWSFPFYVWYHDLEGDD